MTLLHYGLLETLPYTPVYIGAGNMTQWLGALACLPKDLAQFLELARYLTIICNLSPRKSNTVFWPQEYQAFTW